MNNTSQHRATVTGLLLIVHFAIVGFTSFSAILLGIHHSESGFDALRIIFGVLAADLVLLACAEGIRHGVFHGFQKVAAKAFYLAAFIDVCGAVYAEGNSQFAEFYLGTVLPISGPVMGFASFILLASYLDIKVSNRAKGYELALSLDNERAEQERQNLSYPGAVWKEGKPVGSTGSICRPYGKPLSPGP